MRIVDLMDTDVEVADIGLPAEEAWARMRERALAHLVVARGEEVVGVVPRGWLEGPRGRENRDARTLGDFLPDAPVTLTPDCPLAQAASLLEGATSGCVPVLDRGHLVGVITTSGLLRRLGARRLAPRHAPDRAAVRPHRTKGATPEPAETPS